ncbi:MAG: FMN-binding glutamate synthase family protein [Burkholderiaceae bacterium]
MQMLSLIRYSSFVLAVFFAIVLGGLFLVGSIGWGWPLLAVALAVLGVYDLIQRRHSVLRNYPIIGHLRFLFEFIRPELRQYFFESDTDSIPFSRQQRAIVYQRAKQEIDSRAFGTQFDVYESGYEWLNHSASPVKVESHDFRVPVGAVAQASESATSCTRPYSASVFNISAMSFGSLSANAIRALNRGAMLGHFAHDTGEGSISRYHREFGGDLIWEIGSGYFGCRDADGRFDEERFIANATLDQVKMIEIKLSQGAKPGHGGMLPGAKVTEEIAEARGVAAWSDCISPAGHSAFSTPIELLQFIDRLRRLSGGKPVGFKFALGHPWEWFGIAKAMVATGITPDFIVVDGKEGGTGAAPAEFIDRIGTPMRDALVLVHNTLVGLNLRHRIRIGAAGKIVSAFDMARAMALGADWCNSGRGFMFAVGCIQAQVCHTGKCPTGVTTQDPQRQKALDPDDKSVRVLNFHRNTLKSLAELVAAAGLSHPSQLEPMHIVQRRTRGEVHSYATVYPRLQPGELLDSEAEPAVYRVFWSMARPDSFRPVA